MISVNVTEISVHVLRLTNVSLLIYPDRIFIGLCNLIICNQESLSYFPDYTGKIFNDTANPG